MAQEQAAKVSGRHAESKGQVLDRFAVIEKAAEWPRERFSRLVGLVVGINQFTFAFGPSLVGIVRDVTRGYPAALGACMVLQAVAAVTILLGPGKPRPVRRPRDSRR